MASIHAVETKINQVLDAAERSLENETEFFSKMARVADERLRLGRVHWEAEIFGDWVDGE